MTRWAVVSRMVSPAVARLIAAHADETARATVLTGFPGLRRRALRGVVLVIAGGDGLSFRDLRDVEVARMPADRILGVELGPHVQGRPIRPAVLSTVDGPVTFTVGLTPDEQLDAIIAIRTALGRPVG